MRKNVQANKPQLPFAAGQTWGSAASICLMKAPRSSQLFISIGRSVGGEWGVLPAHSAAVWATNCTGTKTLCNRSAIVYSGKVTTATEFRARAEWEGKESLTNLVGFWWVFVQICLLWGYPVFNLLSLFQGKTHPCFLSLPYTIQLKYNNKSPNGQMMSH